MINQSNKFLEESKENDTRKRPQTVGELTNEESQRNLSQTNS